MRRCIAVLLIACLAAGCETVPMQVVSTPKPTAAPEPAAPAMPRKTPVLGAGDQVEVFVWGYNDFSKRVTVNFDGALPYPMLGDIPVAGKTTLAVQEEIRAALTDFIKDPVVRVSVATMRPPKVNVLGEVSKPGVYSFTTPVTRLVEAISMAGGMTLDAQQKTVLVVRETNDQILLYTADFRRITKEGDVASNIALADGDVIYVPPLFMADAVREASRVATLIGSFLIFQNSVILLNPFIRALLHGNAIAPTNPIVITPNP
jgi:polysaccharide export outer membrane protein